MQYVSWLAALAMAAPGLALAQATELPDVHQEAGRDLTGLHRLLNSGRSDFDPTKGDGVAAWKAFLTSVRTALAKDTALSREVAGGPGKWKGDVRELLLRGYITRVHGRQMRKTLAEALRHKTLGGSNQAFAAWLTSTAKSFGLVAKPFGGQGGWEISVGGGRKSMAWVTHVDVHDTDAALWSKDPWAGQVAGRSVHGRGATGGKAGLVAALYALRALHDAAVPLKHTVRLFVSTDDTQGRKGVRAWAKRRRGRAATFVLGVPFPPTRGENGIAQLTVSSLPSGEPDAATEGWRVVSAASVRPLHSVPTEASALLDPRGLPARRALGAMRRTLTLMRKSHPKIQPEVQEEGEYVRLTFRGAPSPAAEPTEARNALADLGVFLSDYLGLFPDHRGRIVRFLAAYVGLDTRCGALGLSATHAQMPAATCTPVAIQETAQGMEVTVEARWPMGRTTQDVLRATRDRAEELVQNLGGVLKVRMSGSDPTLAAADAPDLALASDVYRQLLRREPTPRVLRRGTAARHLPGAIGFGPAPAGTRLHPGPNEAMGIEDLEGATRAYLTLMLRFAAK